MNSIYRTPTNNTSTASPWVFEEKPSNSNKPLFIGIAVTSAIIIVLVLLVMKYGPFGKKKQEELVEADDTPLNEKGEIFVGTGEVLEEYKNEEKPALFVFTAENCIHCVNLKPQLFEASIYLKDLEIIEINESDLQDSDKPLGYPYVFAQTKSGEKISFKGPRCARRLVSFVEEILGKQYVRPSYKKNLKEC